MNLWDNLLGRRYGAKLKPTANAPTSGAASTTSTEDHAAEEAEDTTSAEDRAAAEEAERVIEITAACELAGQPEKAAGFIASGTTTNHVMHTLLRQRERQARLEARHERSDVRRQHRPV